MDIDRLKEMVSTVDVDAAAVELASWIVSNIDKFIDNHRKEFLLSFTAKGSDFFPELRKVEGIYEEADIADGGVDIMSALAEVGGTITDEQSREMADLVKRFGNGEKIEEEEIEAAKEIISKDENWASKMSDEEIAVIKKNDAILDILEGCCGNIQAALLANSKLCQDMFSKLVYYYEVRGFRDGIPVEGVLDGYVRVSNFSYDPYEMPVKITPKTPRVDADGDFVLDDNENIIVDIGEPEMIIEPAGFNLDLEIEYWEKAKRTSIF